MSLSLGNREFGAFDSDVGMMLPFYEGLLGIPSPQTQAIGPGRSTAAFDLKPSDQIGSKSGGQLTIPEVEGMEHGASHKTASLFKNDAVRGADSIFSSQYRPSGTIVLCRLTVSMSACRQHQ